MRRNFALIAAMLLSLLATAPASAQCTGSPAAGRICGNPAASTTLPTWSTMSAILDRAFVGGSGQMLNRGASVWSSTSTPTLGISGSVTGALTLAGSTSGAVSIRPANAAGSWNFTLPTNPGTVGFVLITDGTGNTSWANNAAGGTVQSVGLSMPGIFSVSGSPVTTTGTLTASLATQSANLVWAGPTSGGVATPTFRALVGADLPNPSASTLGGVQSFAAVSSQWIRQISTSGVPTASQPAFTDISGTLAAAQCPNPGASSLGCIQSLAAVTSKWINTISTSGVPTATQPAFTDISGNAALAQLPLIGNNSILGNVSGGTTVPSAITATNILDILGSTQGQILYRNASAWVPLSPGTSGQVLTTGGAAANPAWATVTGTGTVTSVATGTGLTGGPITTTGTIQLATISNNTVLANVSGGALAPSSTTPTLILDIIGSTQGNVLYRAAGNWTVLAPGTNGQVLTMGASTPTWATAGSVTNVTIAAGTGLSTSGTCTITTTGTCTVALSAARQTKPTTQVFLSSSGTYTAPANVLWIEIYMVGAGGGGSGSGANGTAGGNTCWNTSGAACTTPVYQAGGGAGSAGGGVGGLGGTVAGTCITAIAGGPGGSQGGTGAAGAMGGSSSLGGSGAGASGGGSNTGTAGAANSGGGGGGGATASNGFQAGGSGATCYAIINTVAASYTYAVGAAGGAGSGGGAAGGSGYIRVIEHYGT